MLKHRVTGSNPHLGPSRSASLPRMQKSSSSSNAAVMITGTDGFKSDEAKEGIKRLSVKYDSVGNISANCHSPLKSPIGSPARSSPMSDSGHFVFPDPIMTQKFREGVNEQDLLQVETFYRSHKTEVYVCGCLANMYIGGMKSNLSNDEWVFSSTGIPVLVLDTGAHVRERKLHIILAEKGTGFTLWKDVIDNLTRYRAPNTNFHTLHLSTDHSKLAGLSFDDAAAASEFLTHIQNLTSDPDDELLKIGKVKKKKSMKDKKHKVKLPKKSEISQPCCFIHVTKLDRPTSMPALDNVPEDANSAAISSPFNFQHMTVRNRSASANSGSLTNLMGSKLTISSNESGDSGVSEDRTSGRTERS